MMEADPETAGMSVTHRKPSGALVYITPRKVGQGSFVRGIAVSESQRSRCKIYPDDMPVVRMKINSIILIAGTPWGDL
jgi:hypothetical protein